MQIPSVIVKWAIGAPSRTEINTSMKCVEQHLLITNIKYVFCNIYILYNVCNVYYNI